MKLILSAVAALMLAATSTSAAVVDWTAWPDGSQEAPPVFTTGNGAAFGTLDTVSGALSWTVTFADLIGTPTAMHFHGPAGPGVNAGVQVNIGAISGLGSPSVGSTIILSSQVADLLAGLYYINLHTDAFAGGEIRGQVAVTDVPAPLTAPLAISAFAALGLFARRRALA
jgi:hypothetical protein